MRDPNNPCLFCNPKESGIAHENGAICFTDMIQSDMNIFWHIVLLLHVNAVLNSQCLLAELQWS